LKDLIAHWEIIRNQAKDCAALKDLVEDGKERTLLAWLAEQLNTLALELERALTATAHDSTIN
jgi:hypothetical protein